MLKGRDKRDKGLCIQAWSGSLTPIFWGKIRELPGKGPGALSLLGSTTSVEVLLGGPVAGSQAWRLSSPCSAPELLCSLSKSGLLPFLTLSFLICKMGEGIMRNLPGLCCRSKEAEPTNPLGKSTEIGNMNSFHY